MVAAAVASLPVKVTLVPALSAAHVRTMSAALFQTAVTLPGTADVATVEFAAPIDHGPVPPVIVALRAFALAASAPMTMPPAFALVMVVRVPPLSVDVVIAVVAV